jgi:2-polyprenyl-3-methyl-5-hydroxy-6-metoxy-1,4-benzoquinol methylase
MRESVKTYYGDTLQQTSDLKTNACTASKPPPEHIRKLLGKLHPETIAKYYGCGLCLPDYDLTGMHVLDLGCGAGRDVYLASQLVGSTGRVIGIDMTDAQLQTAQQHAQFHAQQFGYANCEFHKGYLEELDTLIENGTLQPESIDVIISNCVLNLCTDKYKVLQACYKLLKPGGEMYFSDVYADRRVPMVLQRDSVLWGECLSGALYWNDFVNMAIRAGFTDPRVVEDAPVPIGNRRLQAQIDEAGASGLAFYSATYRLWKIDNLEPDRQDYGQAVLYKGTLPRHASQFVLDKDNVFESNRVQPVCGNTWRMLQTPPLRDHFQFVGDFSKHFGIYQGASLPFGDAKVDPDIEEENGKKFGCC